ncbi:MAG: XdhC/CoxI family protein [Actinomycetota bacterium]
MRDVLPILERWLAAGRRVAVATVVETRGSAPRTPGATLALSDRGEIVGSVTGGCVEPAVIAEAEEVLAGGPARLRTFGISDEDGMQVGLACGGTVRVFIEPLVPEAVPALAAALAADRPAALVTTVEGGDLGGMRVVGPGDASADTDTVARLLRRGETGLVDAGDATLFVASFVPRPDMYVFGAIDHASALVRVGRFLGYRVTVCDARAAFVTRERFPDADRLAVAWPHRFLAEAPVDERTVICVLTHDPKFDVPAIRAALATPAAYVGAMGSRRTTADRAARLREEGVGVEEIARIHAPIGLPIGARTPEEVAVAIGAQIVAVTRRPTPAAPPLTAAGAR